MWKAGTLSSRRVAAGKGGRCGSGTDPVEGGGVLVEVDDFDGTVGFSEGLGSSGLLEGVSVAGGVLVAGTAEPAPAADPIIWPRGGAGGVCADVGVGAKSPIDAQITSVPAHRLIRHANRDRYMQTSCLWNRLYTGRGGPLVTESQFRVGLLFAQPSVRTVGNVCVTDQWRGYSCLLYWRPMLTLLELPKIDNQKGS